MKNVTFNRANCIINNWLLSRSSFLFFVILLFSLESMAQKDTVRDYRIMINSYHFDPLRNPPQKDTALDAFNAKADSVYQLIQFKNSLTREQMNIIKKQYGLKADQYIPNFAYLERVKKSQLEKIKSLPFYRWSGNYEPVYKISPKIGTMKFKTAERKQLRNLLIWAICHNEANADTILKRLRKTAASQIEVIDERKYKGSLKFKFQIPDKTVLFAIAKWDEIKRIEEVSETFDDNGFTAGTIQSGTPGTTPIWDAGIHGEGQIIGILDGGAVDINHCFFIDNVDNTPGPSHRKVTGHRSTGISDHATFVAGIATGDNVNNLGNDANRGMAWAARFTDAQRNSGAILTQLNESHSDGAFIHTNSWHDEIHPQYNQVARDVDNFLWNNEDNFLCGSSGNTGVGEEIGPPGTAKNALCVSATSRDPNEMNFGDGNNGPTDDGRRKPEIFAPGCTITSAQASTNCTITVDDIVFGDPTPPVCATSWATPAIAGSAAMIRQYYTEGWYPNGVKNPAYSFIPSGALIKATLLNSTLDMTGIAGYPGVQEGWGLIRLNNVLYLPGSLRNLLVWDVRNANGLFTGEQDSHNVDVLNAGTPLKVSLVWTDPPAAAGSATPWINDLTLTVTAPNGDVFTGNDFNANQSRANGGTSDGMNNVEMVLINAPQVGRYVIRISGTAINQGPQGYALVATADTEDPPVPTGTQNTLVVLTELPGTNPAGAPSQPNATNLMTSVNDYITEASYGVTTINPTFVNVTLTTPLGTYLATTHNPLIEMTQDIVAHLVADNPNVFNQGTAATNDDIDRIVILINDRNFTGDWATTGGWPYDLPDGLTSRLSVSVSSVFNDPEQRLSHAVCHQLGLMDLYPHPGVVFAQPHVDNWDIMSNLNAVQPMAWSKEKALWLSTHDAASVLWIPRPAAGANVDQIIPLNFLSSTNTANRRAIAIGLTPNVATLADENVFFFIEARSNATGTVDAGLPGSGVLLYYVNENIRQGEGPVRIIDRTTGTSTLDDAQLDAIGQVHDLFGSYGLRVSRVAITGAEDARVRVEYDPIETQNDVNIVAGDPYWTSPDIWIDQPENGYDASPADHGEQPVEGGVNRIYFKVHNPGPGTAFDVTVSVRLSEPWHTVGGEDDFNRFVAQKFYASIASGAEIVDFVEWTPVVGAEPHNCVKVIIENVVNDINSFNNTAQENVDVQESSTASPYEPVTFHFSATNPYDYYQLVYFRAENVPKGWSANFSEAKRLLNAHERFEGTLTVQPPDTALVCTDRQIFVTSWMPKGNTLIQLGGSTLQINLRNRTTLTATTTGTPCRNNIQSSSGSKYSNAKCYTLTTTGCTNPVRANEDIIIRYEDPEGNPVYRIVRTDAMGCYSDTYVVADGGEWKVTVKYPGSKCGGNSTTGVEVVVVPLPPSTGGTGQGGNGIFPTHPRNVWYSFHVGSSHPLGSLNNNADANIYAMADLTYPINTNLNLQLLVGIAQMTNSSTIAGKNPRWTHISANMQRIFPRVFDMKPYLRAGVGLYSDFANNTTMGVNIGLGGIVKMSNQLFLSPGIDLHMPALSSKDQRPYFMTAHIGIIFK